MENRYAGEFNGIPISFNRIWSGHYFSDDECEALCRGENIEFDYVNKNGKQSHVKGSLDFDVYHNKPIVKFTPDWAKKDSSSSNMQAFVDFYDNTGEITDLIQSLLGSKANVYDPETISEPFFDDSTKDPIKSKYNTDEYDDDPFYGRPDVKVNNTKPINKKSKIVSVSYCTEYEDIEGELIVLVYSNKCKIVISKADFDNEYITIRDSSFEDVVKNYGIIVD